MTPIISIDNLDFAYGQTLVLKHIHLSVEAGQTVGVIGPNGGGKTTLVRLLSGQLTPTRGSITVAGLPPRVAVRRGDVIGYLPQNPRVEADFPISVRQMVTLGLAGKTGLLRRHRQDDLEHVQSLLDRLGLDGLADEPIGGLSGGQLQRVFIARALAPRPKVLILDEPTTGIDLAGQQAFTAFLKDLRRELNLTMVFISHDLRAVAAIADRIACLNVTLHFHDVPSRMPGDVVQQLFACDLEAAFGNTLAGGDTSPVGKRRAE